MRTGVIYLVRFPTGKVYVGKTVQTLRVRQLYHYRMMIRGKKGKFYNALRKYQGKEEWIILAEKVSEDLLNIYEIGAISTYDSYINGYNTTIGGEGGQRAQISEIHKRRISKSLKGHVIPENVRKLISTRTKEAMARPEVRAKLRKNKGI